ncbi:MAG: universal stress protein [Caulobacter sp.]|nr:universal stress protein [Caulobacter sp.]
MKTVLLFVHDDPGQEARLQAALALTRTLTGHLTCVDIAPTPFVAGDFTGEAYARVLQQERSTEAANRAVLQARLGQEGESWDWIDAEGGFTERLMQQAGLSDVIVVNCKRDRLLAPEPRGIVSDVLSQARCPVIAVPDYVFGFDACGPAVVAWDGSAPCMTALRGAVPLLEQAVSVSLVTVGDGRQGAPVEAAAAYLSRHGVHADIDQLDPRGERPDAVILRACAVRDASYCVMGAFGRGRLSGALFGGVTRRMLDAAELPLVMGR